jgi:DNA topoisomerase VI subunit B
MELLLADNGVGIEKDDLKHIFERLYKCDKGRSEKGSGLGLSIVHQLVEKMGGSITVESFPGEGTEFMLLLILDEPINGLDPIGIAEVRSFIRELCDARGKNHFDFQSHSFGDFLAG